MLKFAAFAAAAASVASPPVTLSSSAPWWEKVTVTIAGDGTPHSCQYQSSLIAGEAQKCDVEAEAQSLGAGKSGSKDELTSITFERRFTPNAQPTSAKVEAGDTLIGGQVLALAIDEAGAVSGCKVVASAGGMTPDYGCAEAKAERFQASARSEAEAGRQGYLTVLVYGHAENVA